MTVDRSFNFAPPGGVCRKQAKAASEVQSEPSEIGADLAARTPVRRGSFAVRLPFNGKIPRIVPQSVPLVATEIACDMIKNVPKVSVFSRER